MIHIRHRQRHRPDCQRHDPGKELGHQIEDKEQDAPNPHRKSGDRQGGPLVVDMVNRPQDGGCIEHRRAEDQPKDGRTIEQRKAQHKKRAAGASQQIPQEELAQAAIRR